MLFFNISAKEDKLSVEIVKVSLKGRELTFVESKKIYPQDVQKKLDHQVASFLIEEQIKALKSKGHLVSSSTVEMNRLALSENALIKLFEILAKSELVFFNKKNVNVEKSKANFIFKCRKSNDTLQVFAFVDAKNTLFQISDCSFINSWMVIVDGSLYLYKEMLESRWLKAIRQEQVILEKREAKYFLEDFEYQISFEDAQKKEAIPFLFLSDPAGVSASLKFKYDDELFDSASCEGSHIRDYETEKALQNDLKEAGYEQKVGQSAFYCPQPKVFEALKLLIEIGWGVFNYRQKKVRLESASSVEVKKDGENLELKAEIFFEDEAIGTDKVLQACIKQQSFLELNNEVALFDSVSYQKKLKGFLEEGKAYLPLAKITEIADMESSLEKNLLRLRDVFTKECKFPEVEPSKSFSGKLLNYQKVGLNWLNFLYENKLGGLLADEMGLGKTVQVLAFFSRLRNFCPVLIVAPKSLINNWRSEFKRFLPSANVSIYYGVDRRLTFDSNSFILTTYGTLREDVEKFSQSQFECVVLDESSFIKNDKTKSNQAVASLRSFFKVCLNGTPIENSINDLISQFNFLIPNLIHTKHSEKKINALIAPFLLKRTKASVEIDLPEKSEQIVYVDLDDQQRVLYEKMLKDARSVFSGKEAVKSKKMHVFEVLLRLRQICCDPDLIESDAPSAKLEQVLLDIQSVASTHKILVFSQFTKMLQKIRKRLEKYEVLYLDGKTTMSDRQKKVSDFQNREDPCIFLMSLKAAGYGLNLQSADYVFIFDPWWNEAVEKQAIDRAHRIGRSRSLIAKKYLTTDTIEEKIYRLKLDKLKMSDQFIPQNLSTDDLYRLLH